MKTTKRYMVIGILATFLAIGGFVVTSTITQASNQSIKPNILKDSAGNVTTQISLMNNKATPDTITVLTGETVQFNAKDNKTHDMAEGEGSANGHSHDHEGGFESGAFGANHAWRVTFKKVGNYYFHDHENPDINVLVIVYNTKA